MTRFFVSRRAFLAALTALARTVHGSSSCSQISLSPNWTNALLAAKTGATGDALLYLAPGYPFLETKLSGIPEFAWPPAAAMGVRSPVPADPSSTLTTLTMAYEAFANATGNGSLESHASLHKLNCQQRIGGSIHQFDKTKPGLFLVWHRAFLFFHERLLQWRLETNCGLSHQQAAAFRLPYWHSDLTAEPSDVYWRESLSDGTCNPLFHTRRWSPSGTATALQSLARGLDPKITDLSSRCTDLENWHNYLHTDIQGDMSDIGKSAVDPLFYAWHANVDRAWAGVATDNTVLGDTWFVFYDAYGGQWVKVPASRFRDTAALGYTYDSPLTSAPDAAGAIKERALLAAANISLTLTDVTSQPPGRPPYTLYVYAGATHIPLRTIPACELEHHAGLPLRVRIDRSFYRRNRTTMRFYLTTGDGHRIDVHPTVQLNAIF